MKKRARIVSGLAAFVALFLAARADASLTRSSNPAREAPALALTLAAPEPSEFSLFEGTELARALASRPAFDLISITTDDTATAGRRRFVSPSELSADELPNDAPELLPITSVREQRFNPRIPPDVFGLEPLRGPPGDEASYPKTRYRVFGLLGTPILGELRGVTLDLHWGCGEFRAGLASGTVGWLSQDPLGDNDSPNLYGFVGARPHEKTDPLGLEASLSQSGWFVIANPKGGKIQRISPQWAREHPSGVWYALKDEGGLSDEEAADLIGKAGLPLVRGGAPCRLGQTCLTGGPRDRGPVYDVAERSAAIPICGLSGFMNNVDAVMGQGPPVPCPIGPPNSERQEQIDKALFMYSVVTSVAMRGGPVGEEPVGGNTTRLGVTRANPTDWRGFRSLMDEMGVGDMISPANRRLIANGRTPIVDSAWQKYFPEAKLGEPIPMHHIGGYPLTVPLTSGQHFDAHMPGGYRYNPGGPGANVPEQNLVKPRP
jgi:hypothetical protein